MFAISALARALPVSDQDDPFSVTLSQRFVHDSNLYRLPDRVRPAAVESRDDTVGETELSTRYSNRISQQHVALDASLLRASYRDNDRVDYTARSGGATWDWRLGERWQGTLLAAQAQTLRNFADVAQQQRSVNTRRRAFADANFRLSADFSLGVGARYVSSRDSDEQASAAEYDEDTVELKLSYRPVTENVLALLLSSADGRYPGRDPQSPQAIDSGYRQDNLLLQSSWRLTGNSVLTGYAGYSWRRYDNLSQRDYDDFTGRLSHQWQITGKLNLITTLRREIGADIDLVENYVVTTAASMDAVWQLSDHITLSAGAAAYRRNYLGDPELGVSDSPDKSDTTQLLRCGASYAPTRGIDLALVVQEEHRDARNYLREYHDSTASIQITYLW